jgi:hypothetical protein
VFGRSSDASLTAFIFEGSFGTSAVTTAMSRAKESNEKKGFIDTSSINSSNILEPGIYIFVSLLAFGSLDHSHEEHFPAS